MKTVLITGRMGVGKSTLLALLKNKGFPVFKADEAAKKLLEGKSPCYREIKKLFPESHLYQTNGEWNKKNLASLIFNRPDKKEALEQIIHPQVKKMFKQFKQKNKGHSLIFYEAPLLSTKLLNSFDCSILVVSLKELQEGRLLKQGWTRKEIRERLSSQLKEKEFQDKVDFIIENKKTKKNLETQIDNVLQHLK